MHSVVKCIIYSRSSSSGLRAVIEHGIQHAAILLQIGGWNCSVEAVALQLQDGVMTAAIQRAHQIFLLLQKHGTNVDDRPKIELIVVGIARKRHVKPWRNKVASLDKGHVGAAAACVLPESHKHIVGAGAENGDVAGAHGQRGINGTWHGAYIPWN